jgi:putative Ca2+/H+ antiporter (TMEM165/GDT1 family)
MKSSQQCQRGFDREKAGGFASLSVFYKNHATIPDPCLQAPPSILEAFFTSTVLVAIAEIGDKTQLLSFVLAAKLRRPYPIMAGIFTATLLNHALAASVGAWLASLVPSHIINWIVGLSFIGCGLWALKPDTLEENPSLVSAGAFVTTVIAFFLAEMGDKTQLATVALAARYDALTAVVLGTTLGMMLANAPAVWAGKALAGRINMEKTRWLAAALFLLMGVWSLAGGIEFR